MIDSLIMIWMKETHQYDVATLFNSKSTLRSINLSTEYGDPFDEEKSLK